MVHLTYSTINDTLLESSGPFHYSYNTIEVIRATVISMNNPEKKKDVTAVINSLILKSGIIFTSILIANSLLQLEQGYGGICGRF